jgi:uncharacterized protein YdhG (YjbR/CyaY superfamily)
MAATKSPAKRPGNVWTDEERAAMQASARERRSASRRDPAAERAEGERNYRESVARMPEPDRSMAERIDAVVMAAVPDFARKTYYGMPAYAKDGNVICWVKNASKFKMRYDTLEFSDKAHLDDGAVWPASYAIKELTADAEARIAALVKTAAS